MVPGSPHPGWGGRVLRLEKEKQSGYEISLWLRACHGELAGVPVPTLPLLVIARKSLQSPFLGFGFFSVSLIKGVDQSQVSSNECKHSCCPHTPIFCAGDKPSAAPSFIHLRPYTPLYPILPGKWRPRQSSQHSTAAVEIERRHESSWIQQLSRSDDSMKLKQALDCLLAGGCSSNPGECCCG